VQDQVINHGKQADPFLKSRIGRDRADIAAGVLGFRSPLARTFRKLFRPAYYFTTWISMGPTGRRKTRVRFG
jgi:hypothetical protein